MADEQRFRFRLYLQTIDRPIKSIYACRCTIRPSHQGHLVIVVYSTTGTRASSLCVRPSSQRHMNRNPINQGSTTSAVFCFVGDGPL